MRAVSQCLDCEATIGKVNPRTGKARCQCGLVYAESNLERADLGCWLVMMALRDFVYTPDGEGLRLARGFFQEEVR